MVLVTEFQLEAPRFRDLSGYTAGYGERVTSMLKPDTPVQDSVLCMLIIVV